MGPLRAVPTLLLRTEVGMGRLVDGVNAGTPGPIHKSLVRRAKQTPPNSDALGRVWLRLESIIPDDILVEVSC